MGGKVERREEREARANEPEKLTHPRREERGDAGRKCCRPAPSPFKIPGKIHRKNDCY
jgi:hypothetical protein